MHSKKGFSLLEIILVIGIAGVIAGIVSFSLVRVSNSNKVKMVKAAQESILAGLETFKVQVGHYPLDQTEFENMLLNKCKDENGNYTRTINIFSGVPQNPYWNDNKNHPEKGWLWDPLLLTVTPIMPSQ